MFETGVTNDMDAFTAMTGFSAAGSKFLALDQSAEPHVTKSYIEGSADGILFMWLECNDSGSGCEPFFDGDEEYSYLWVDGAANSSTPAPRVPMYWGGPVTLKEQDGAVELAFAAAAAMVAFIAF